MLYFTTGNAGPWNGDTRPGDSLFSTSFVALPYKTGQYKWHFQQVHHDRWDFDAPSPPVLFDQTIDGQPRKGIYGCGNTGWCYPLDRSNGGSSWAHRAASSAAAPLDTPGTYTYNCSPHPWMIGQIIVQ